MSWIYNKIILLLLFINSILFAQNYEIRGRIVDAVTGAPLSFANVRVTNSTSGTAAAITGEYSLKLTRGNYKLIASFIGYDSDTIAVNLNNNLQLNFALTPATIELNEVTVTPGVNPAVEIIKNAIDRKHNRNKKLNSYIFEAYTKGKILTTQDITTGSNSVGVGIGTADSAELKITGIIENQSKGYFLRPDYYKEEIIARKQSANFPSTINILTGGRIIQNFYSDDIQFFGGELTGPIADYALDYYYYYIEDTLAIDNRKVFQIYFSTIDDRDPGFYGRIFILDQTFDLLKVDVDLNAAANPGGIFTKVNIFQQFVPYNNNIYMPIDYRLFVEGNYLGLLKFGFEVNSILYDYEINSNLTEEDFGMMLLKVKPDADEKDSTYWQNVQTIPPTELELEAYQRIDSLESIETSFWERFSPLAGRLNLDNNFYFSGPINMYHFNRVEGHSIDLELGANNLLDERFNANLDFSYGFSDKKVKKEIGFEYLLGDYRTTSVKLNVFDKTKVLFEESDKYNSFSSTLTSLLGKYDFRNYYSSAGFEFNIEKEVFPILKLSAGFINRTDKSLNNNSNYSFFYKDKSYSNNLQIYKTKINAFKIGFDFDFRQYIEDGKYRRRVSSGQKSPIRFSGESLISNSSFLKSQMDFQVHTLAINSRVRSFSNTFFDLDIEGTLSNNAVPFQMMKALPGNLESLGKNNSFRTLSIGEVFGDKIATVFFDYNFGTDLWRMLNIYFLQDWQINLTGYINGAYVDVSNNSRSILSHDFRTFKNPFWEGGFGISHPLIPLQLEFTWKLNHRNGNNFVIGINTFLL